MVGHNFRTHGQGVDVEQFYSFCADTVFRQKISKASSAFLPFLLSRLTFYLYRINSIFYPVGPILSTCNINRQTDVTHTHTHFLNPGCYLDSNNNEDIVNLPK